MKKITLLFTLIICAFTLHAQSPNAFNYQAIVRDLAGVEISNTNVAVRLSIREATTVGIIVYRERQVGMTNQFGLFTCQIGTGNALIGTIDSVNWAGGIKFLQVEIDPTGGVNYIDMGTTQLISVPYAKVADVINMFPGGLSNPDKMIITHSPAYQTYGLQYQDASDKFNYLSNNISVLTVDLGNKYVGIGTSSPRSQLHVKGNYPSQADTGMVTINNTGTGSAIYASGVGTAAGSGAVISAENKNAGTAIIGATTGAGWAVYGYNPAGVAGHFAGDLEVTSNERVTGYTQLGSTAPSIKMKKLTGTTSPNTGSNSNMAHGLNSDKILSVSVMVESSSGSFVMPDYTYIGGYQFQYFVNSSDVIVFNMPGSLSANLLSKPIRVLITYEE